MVSQVQKHCTHGGKEKIANPISKIDDCVKHTFREHNQEAFHWANLGGQRDRGKIIIDRSNNNETWKAEKSLWDGRLQEQL